MNKKQIEELKTKLEESRDSLQETLETFAKKNDDLEEDWKTKFPDFQGGLEESADEVEEYSSLLSVEHALELKLKRVNEALEKIDKGDFGKCEKCGEDISHERLSIIPETKVCKRCN